MGIVAEVWMRHGFDRDASPPGCEARLARVLGVMRISVEIAVGGMVRHHPTQAQQAILRPTKLEKASRQDERNAYQGRRHRTPG